MKKFVFYSIICCVAVLNDTRVLAQISSGERKLSIIHTDANGKKYDWTLSNEGCYGCASFFWKVERTEQTDPDGFYDFIMLFSTNSFYGDKTLTSTYISDIKIFFIDNGKEYQAVETFYMLVPPKVPKIKKFKSKDIKQVLNVQWAPLRLLNRN